LLISWRRWARGGPDASQRPDERGIRVGWLSRGQLTDPTDVADYPHGVPATTVDDQGTMITTTKRGALQVGRGEHLVPVLGYENQVSLQENTQCLPAEYHSIQYEFEYTFSVQLRYYYRLDLRPCHRVAFGKAFGCARVVFNDALHAREAAHQAGQPYVTDSDLSAWLTAIKKTPRRAWLNEVSSVVLQQALADLNAAYRNFFASLNGTRKGPRVEKPRFRSRKDHRQAIRFTANTRFKVLPNGKLRLPKIGDVPVRWSRPLPSEPSSVTVIRDSAGRYFASFVVETEPGMLPEVEPVAGIDLGLTHFAVLSNGTKIASPQFLRRVVRFRGHAGVQGPAARPGVPPDQPVHAHLANLLGLRGERRPQAAARPRVDVHGVRGAPGPGHQRGGQRRQGRRAGGDSL
jgi:hypothetical protein